MTYNTDHDTWQRAMDAWEAGDHQTSFALLQKLSATDDGHNYDSQGYLAFHYLNGLGVAQSYSKGLYWLERAVLQGDDVVLDWFRRLQDSIKRIEKNLRQLSPQALELFAAEQYPALTALVQEQALQNDANCQYLMGRFCEYGDNVKDVPDSGLYWYQQAAAQHQADAQHALGECYENGLWKVEKDLTQACAWYEKAAGQNDARALCRLGFLSYEGIPNSLGDAFACFQKAAQLNDAEALYELAGYYMDGDEVPQDYEKAREYYEKAAALGYFEAYNQLEEIYADGLGVVADAVKANEYREKIPLMRAALRAQL